MTDQDRLAQALAYLGERLPQKLEVLVQEQYNPSHWRRRTYFQELNPRLLGSRSIIPSPYYELAPGELDPAFWETPLAEALLTTCQAYEPEKAQRDTLENLLLEAIEDEVTLESFLRWRLPGVYERLT